MITVIYVLADQSMHSKVIYQENNLNFTVSQDSWNNNNYLTHYI